MFGRINLFTSFYHIYCCPYFSFCHRDIHLQLMVTVVKLVELLNKLVYISKKVVHFKVIHQFMVPVICNRNDSTYH